VNISFCIFKKCQASKRGGGFCGNVWFTSRALLCVVHANFTGCVAQSGWALMLIGFNFNLVQTIFDPSRTPCPAPAIRQEFVRVDQVGETALRECRISSAYFGTLMCEEIPEDFKFINGCFEYAVPIPITGGDVFLALPSGGIDNLFNPPLPFNDVYLRLWPITSWANETGWLDLWPQDVSLLGGGTGPPIPATATTSQTYAAQSPSQSQPPPTGTQTQAALDAALAGGVAGSTIAFIVIACLLFVGIIIIILWLCVSRARCCNAVGSDGKDVTYF
jgi:hypothetical protein